MKTLFYLVGASAAFSFAVSAPPKAQAYDAKVDALLVRVAGAYRNLRSLSATLDVSQGSGPAAIKVTSKFVIKKPNLVSATIVRGGETRRFVADGSYNYTATSKDPIKYFKIPSKDFSSSDFSSPKRTAK